MNEIPGENVTLSEPDGTGLTPQGEQAVVLPHAVYHEQEDAAVISPENSQPEAPVQDLETEKFDLGERQLIRRIYAVMAASLLLTAASALFTERSLAEPDVIGMDFLSRNLLMLFEMLSVLVLSRYVKRFNFAVTFALLMFFSLLNGITFSRIFGTASGNLVSSCALLSALAFAGMAVYSWQSGVDLRAKTSLLLLGVCGVLVTLPKLLLMHAGLNTALVVVLIVIICSGLVSYHRDDLTDLYGEFDGEMQSWQSACCGALLLLLSFVNIYIICCSFLSNFVSKVQTEREDESEDK